MTSLLPKCHRLYYDLWHDRSWINRRIDEVKIISSGATKTKSTFDLNVKKLNAIANYHNIAKGERIAVPLFVQPRMPMVDVNIDLNGKSQSLGGSSSSASVASCICIHDILDQLNADPSAETINILYPPLYEWLLDRDLEKATRAIRLASSEIVDSSRTLIPAWDLRRWSKLSDNFVVVVYLDRLQDNENAKLTCEFSTMYNSREEFERSDFLVPKEGLEECQRDKNKIDKKPSETNKFHTKIKSIVAGIRALFLFLKAITLKVNIFFAKIVIPAGKKLFFPRFQDIPFTITGGQLGTGFEERYHLKFHVPDGLEISSLNIYESCNDISPVRVRKPTYVHRKHTLGRCYCRACERIDSLNCQVAYTSASLEIHDLTKMQPGGNGKSYHLRIGMEPSRGFKYPLLICCYMLVLYLFLVRYIKWQDSDLATFSLTSAAFFVALPFLFRRYKEHDFTLEALRRGRVIIALSVVTCLTGGFFSYLVGNKECLCNSSSSSGEIPKYAVSCVVEPFGYMPWVVLLAVIVSLVIFLVCSMLRSIFLQTYLIDQLSVINDGVKFSVPGSP